MAGETSSGTGSTAVAAGAPSRGGQSQVLAGPRRLSPPYRHNVLELAAVTEKQRATSTRGPPRPPRDTRLPDARLWTTRWREVALIGSALGLGRVPRHADRDGEKNDEGDCRLTHREDYSSIDRCAGSEPTAGDQTSDISDLVPIAINVTTSRQLALEQEARRRLVRPTRRISPCPTATTGIVRTTPTTPATETTTPSSRGSDSLRAPVLAQCQREKHGEQSNCPRERGGNVARRREPE